jgi:type IV secretory pathway VirB3-like protein
MHSEMPFSFLLLHSLPRSRAPPLYRRISPLRAILFSSYLFTEGTNQPVRSRSVFGNLTGNEYAGMLALMIGYFLILVHSLSLHVRVLLLHAASEIVCMRIVRIREKEISPRRKERTGVKFAKVPGEK